MALLSKMVFPTGLEPACDSLGNCGLSFRLRESGIRAGLASNSLQGRAGLYTARQTNFETCGPSEVETQPWAL